MHKETDLARCSRPQTHRTYTRQYKAELVAASQQPGASIAALALQHGMNANVLHRWQPSFAIPPFEARALSICDDLQGRAGKSPHPALLERLSAGRRGTDLPHDVVL